MVAVGTFQKNNLKTQLFMHVFYTGSETCWTAVNMDSCSLAYDASAFFFVVCLLGFGKTTQYALPPIALDCVHIEEGSGTGWRYWCKNWPKKGKKLPLSFFFCVVSICFAFKLVELESFILSISNNITLIRIMQLLDEHHWEEGEVPRKMFQTSLLLLTPLFCVVWDFGRFNSITRKKQNKMVN